MRDKSSVVQTLHYVHTYIHCKTGDLHAKYHRSLQKKRIKNERDLLPDINATSLGNSGRHGRRRFWSPGAPGLWCALKDIVTWNLNVLEHSLRWSRHPRLLSRCREIEARTYDRSRVEQSPLFFSPSPPPPLVCR